MNTQPDLQQTREGVIKYQLDFRPAPPLDDAVFAELNAWRALLFRLKLTGVDPDRYEGLAYGNVSQRVSGTDTFVISGTQTGGLPRLGAEHYCRVLAFDLSRNRLVAEGPVPPSSEALTHAAVYSAASGPDCVLHVHSPDIWRNATRLDLPVTDGQVAYGTPEMAESVKNLLGASPTGVIVMGGHEDGVIVWGLSPRTATLTLIECWIRAVAIQPDQD